MPGISPGDVSFVRTPPFDSELLHAYIAHLRLAVFILTQEQPPCQAICLRSRHTCISCMRQLVD
ncbi:unnamed protein product [Timema podura]|uniref:Uncharacterized protein n=1 Tax=Timema podura TaxID=61482 RepID=A0ABN7P9B4_TIMPD|nr:unnamed protein product [Timema podura]